MKRVFTSDSKDQLFRDIDAVSGKTFSSPGNMSAAGIDTSDAAKLVKSFFEDIFDTNKRAKNQITAIYNNVDMVDKTYKTKMSNQYSALLNCGIYVTKLASIMSRSTNIDSGGFDPANISSTLSPTLTAIYMDRMCETTLDLFGNTAVVYNQEYLKRIMQGDSKDLPEEMYIALIKTFTDMDMDNKAVFLQNSYVETDRYTFTNYEDEVVTWEASPVLKEMSDVYQDWFRSMPVNMDILSDVDNEYHKYSYNASLLQQMVTSANPQYTVNSMYLPSEHHPDIKIYQTEKGLMWDYTIKISDTTGILPVTLYQPSTIEIYQHREDTDKILTNCTIDMANSMKRTAGDQLADVAIAILPDIIGKLPKIGSQLAGPAGKATLIFDIATMFADDAETNTKLDQMAKNLKNGQLTSALHISTSVSIIDGERFVVNSSYMDNFTLNESIRAYEREEGNIGLTADDIADIIKNGGTNDLTEIFKNYENVEKYIDSYGDWGEVNKTTYQTCLFSAFSDHKGLFSGKQFKELTYEDMMKLEEDYPEYFQK